MAAALDDSGVECLELAVPFPDSVTDGPVVRRSARRALDAGVTAAAVLDAVAAVRPRLRRLRIALLADFGHTVKGPGLAAFTARAADAGCDGLLLHGLPPRLREPYLDAAARAGLPVVATCYAVSRPEAVARAAADASAYLYLVAHYGRSGTTAPPTRTRWPGPSPRCARPRGCPSPSVSACAPPRTSNGWDGSAPTPPSSAARPSPGSSRPSRRVTTPWHGSPRSPAACVRTPHPDGRILRRDRPHLRAGDRRDRDGVTCVSATTTKHCARACGRGWTS